MQQEIPFWSKVLIDDIKQFSLPEFYTGLHIHLFPLSNREHSVAGLSTDWRKLTKYLEFNLHFNLSHGQVQLKQHIINKAVIRQPGKIHLYRELIYYWIHLI